MVTVIVTTVPGSVGQDRVELFQSCTLTLLKAQKFLVGNNKHSGSTFGLFNYSYI